MIRKYYHTLDHKDHVMYHITSIHA